MCSDLSDEADVSICFFSKFLGFTTIANIVNVQKNLDVYIWILTFW